MSRIPILCAALIATSVSTARAGAAPPTARATRAASAIVIDGSLDDAAWAGATPEGDFWQREPREGEAPTYATEFRVAYDDDALYVAVRAHDPRPDRIRTIVTRRDQESASDWIELYLAPPRDHRNAVGFAVSAANVKRDWRLFDDVRADADWEGVWDAATSIDDRGWCAEFRIPYDQQPIARGDRDAWGLQVGRVIPRLAERSYWSPSPRSKNRWVSAFGELRGIERTERRVDLTVTPYSLASLELATTGTEPAAAAGVDVSYAPTGTVRWTGTIFPDFGQVEADPAVVDLTAREVYYPEKRPLFTDDAALLQLSVSPTDGEDEQTLFYSRRIGAPTAEREDGAAIYAASKLTGTTGGGWSFGLLDAVTAPGVNYGVARVGKDLRGGRSHVDVAVTAVDRRLAGAELDELPATAYAAGLRLDHKFLGDDWSLNARAFGSRVAGEPAAIDRLQRAYQRYYQRPDADHVTYDPTRRSLSGAALMLDLSRLGGDHWHGGAGADLRSPGFEVNDLGFQRTADSAMSWIWGEYRDDQPAGLHSYAITGTVWSLANWQPQNDANGVDLSGRLTTRGQWTAGAAAGLIDQRMDSKLLRGGPAVRGDAKWHGSGSIASDPRRAVGVAVGGGGSLVPASRSYSSGASATIRVRAGDNLQLSLAPSFSLRSDATQFVAEVTADPPRYLLARVRQQTVALTARADYAPTPRLSFQLYGQPLVSDGRFTGYRELVDPHAARFDDRYRAFAGSAVRASADVVSIDSDGDGTGDLEVDRPDFDRRILRTTAVVRWEYLTGSTLYLVWSHARASAGGSGRAPLVDDLDALAHESGEHVVTMKLTYRWDP